MASFLRTASTASTVAPAVAPAGRFGSLAIRLKAPGQFPLTVARANRFMAAAVVAGDYSFSITPTAIPERYLPSAAPAGKSAVRGRSVISRPADSADGKRTS